jgi:hypothetical protein
MLEITWVPKRLNVAKVWHFPQSKDPRWKPNQQQVLWSEKCTWNNSRVLLWEEMSLDNLPLCVYAQLLILAFDSHLRPLKHSALPTDCINVFLVLREKGSDRFTAMSTQRHWDELFVGNKTVQPGAHVFRAGQHMPWNSRLALR